MRWRKSIRRSPRATQCMRVAVCSIAPTPRSSVLYSTDSFWHYSGDLLGQHAKARCLHSMAFCLGCFHNLPEITIPILVKPPLLTERHVRPRFALRCVQLVCEAHRHVAIPSCYSAFIAILHLLRGHSMLTECGPSADARFVRLWVCLMACDGSSEATDPRGKVGSNVL